MRKSVLTLSVAAALTTPGLVLAQQAAPAAPAAPTLDKVLDASGIAVTGYIDAWYQHANRDIQNGPSDRVFDSQNNAFVLHQVGVQVAKQPKEGFGGLLNVTMGKDAALIHSFDTTTESQFDVTQAYGQYASGPLTVIFGKFTTLIGTEVIWSPSNTQASRSILFGASPFTHTGVRATWAVNDMFSLTGGVNNGWDQVNDSNKDKTIELGATLTPIKALTLGGSYYSGKETVPLATPTAPACGGSAPCEGTRNALDLLGSYTVGALSFGLEYLNVSQQNAPDLDNGGTKKATYSGEAVYLKYMFAPKWSGALRLESFDDKDGLRFGTTSPNKYKESTLTIGYLPADNFEIRGEFRMDKANSEVFTDTSGGNPSKSLTTYAVQVLYKF
jgi:hypothetical protein